MAKLLSGRVKTF